MPRATGFFRISLSELPPDISDELRYWAAGFVAGSTPDPPDEDDMTQEALHDWDVRIERYPASGARLPD